MSEERTEPNPHRAAAGLSRLRNRAVRWSAAGAAALLLAVALAFGLLNPRPASPRSRSSRPRRPALPPRCR